ncbi:MAG: hydroxymethylbilane synthase [Bacteroidota bacterium]
MRIIGTRGSKLALWQANFIKDQLAEKGVESRLEIIKTQGDRIQHLGFDKLEGKGFFTKELEDALLEGRIDLAVHSLKDLPTQQPEGLCLAALSYRADPADCLLINPAAHDPQQPFQLKAGAKVGTSSARRKSQLLALYPGLELVDIRGNVPTRANKARTGEVDAVVLAAAGIERLQLELDGLIQVRLSPREFVPAPGQGVMAIQVKTNRLELRRELAVLHHTEVGECTNVERQLLSLLQGGCQMPLGVHCEQDPSGNFHARAALANDWQSPIKRARLSQTTHAGLAEALLQQLK